MENIFRTVSKISVDCLHNDIENIEAGGPEYLGFDFYVRKEDTKRIKNFIRNTLTTFNLPLINLSVSEHDMKISRDLLWDHKKILDCITEESDYFYSKAKQANKKYSKQMPKI